MGYSSAGGGWMWVFGVLTMVAVLVLIGLVVWAVIAVTNRQGPGAAEASPVETGRTHPAAAGLGRAVCPR